MDDKDEPRPSTSKQDQEKHGPLTNSNTDVEQQDERDTSASSMTNTHSENSGLAIGQERPKAPTGGKKERKPKERKYRGRPAGRVVKRSRRPDTRPTRQRRRSKRVRDIKRKRQLSLSTIFTRLSSNVSMVQGCPHCGHRCCRRRYYEMKRNRVRRFRNFCKREKLLFKCMGTQTSGSECIQAGSRCMMLSPLCLNTNATPPEPITEKQGASEITPEMIHETLRRLTMWRQEVNTDAILDYIKRSYPVGLDERLLAELEEKLRIAAIVGIVTQTGPELWCLSCALQERKLTKNHVTLFWKAYGDTMKPVMRRNEASPEETGQDQENNTVRQHVSVMYDYV